MVAKRGCTVLVPFSCPAPCTYYLVRAEVETVVWVFCRKGKGTRNVHRNCKFGIRLLGTAGVAVLNFVWPAFLMVNLQGRRLREGHGNLKDNLCLHRGCL